LNPPEGCESPAAFEEPWQAQVFALVLALQDRGVVTADEWAQRLGRELHQPDAATDGWDYYPRFVAALTGLMAEKGITTPALIETVAASWQRAAEATPHGRMIELANDPRPTRGWTRRSFQAAPALRREQ
jgi:nitrile hydratase accessory protein